jgi:hypothetical protein
MNSPDHPDITGPSEFSMVRALSVLMLAVLLAAVFGVPRPEMAGSGREGSDR